MSGDLVRLARRYWKQALGVVVGGGVGVAYASFIGCSTGGCAITSNPLLAGAVGALIGLSIAGSPTPERRS